MFGQLGDMAKLLKSAKDMQANMQKMQAELAAQRYEAQAGGGLVKVIVDGKFQLVDIKIDSQAAADLELLEEFIKSAMASALARAQEGVQAGMMSLTGGLNIPGLSDMFGAPGAK